MHFKIKSIQQAVIKLLAISILVSCATPSERLKTDTTDVYLQLGARYLSLNKLSLAKENLEKALEEDSGSVPANNYLGVLYEKLNKFDEAKTYYETAFNIAPDNLEVLNNYGRFLCDRREFTQGMLLLSKAIADRLNDKSWMAFTNAGRCQMAMGNLSKAQEFCTKALESNSVYPPALKELQKINYQQGNYKAAKSFFQRYLVVDSYTPDTLWIAIQTEQALGNDDQAKEYQNLLLEQFPYANEAKQIKSANRLP